MKDSADQSNTPPIPADTEDETTDDGARKAAEKRADDDSPNPPRTTTGKFFTAPKFGSAGSGGAELEPGPERD